MALDRNTTVRLKSFNCGEGDLRLKFEVHQVTDVAASLIVAKRTSNLLKQTFGTPKVVENDVFKAFAGLLKQFGTTHDASRLNSTFKIYGVESSDGAVAVQGGAPGGRVRTLVDLAYSPPFSYPALDEVTALMRRNIPTGLNYYYAVNCLDGARPTDPVCKDYDKDRISMKFWRGMRADDLTNFARNLAGYNRLVRQAANPQGTTVADMHKTQVTNYLKLVRHMAGETWPDDFVVLLGRPSADNVCAESGLNAWDFDFTPRDVMLEVALIENTSKKPISISALTGSRSSDNKLRAVGSSMTPDVTINMKETLAPGQRLLVPTRIVFTPSLEMEHEFPYRQTEAESFRSRGASNMTGNTAGHAAPKFKDYVFGPEIDVALVTANGKQIDLRRRAANFLDITLSTGAGSCPYLMTWDAREQDWINHGKVLHRANNKSLEYTEMVEFEGFQSSFRLEEREPEVAYIDHAALAVTLRNGQVLVLTPDRTSLVARDGDYVRLLWGESIDFAFKVPDGVAENDVVGSRLMVTGYYQRYSNLMAAAEPPSLSRRAQRTGLPFTASSVRLQMCLVTDLTTVHPGADWMKQ